MRLAAIACLLFSSPAFAQCLNWASAGTAGPSPRQDMFIVADTSNHNILQFGGYRGGFGFNNETWLHDGEAWAQAFPPVSPSARGHYAIAFDSLRSRVILFGGTETGSNYLADTWAWNGAAGTWSQLSPPNSPSGRLNHNMVYDAARDRIVLFGGSTATGASSQTWLFNGTTWTQAFPATTPTIRTAYAMTYDPVRQRVIMFGGIPTTSAPTYEWDGTNWTLTATTGPAPRLYVAMSFDEGLGKVILSCGELPGATGRHNDTWSYDGTTWEPLSVGIPGVARDQNGQAYLPGLGTVVFGGYAGAGDVRRDTWVLTCTAPPSCDPDYTCDGNVNQDDIACLIDALAGHPGCECKPLDFNNDGNTDQDDVTALINVVAGGECP